MRTRSRFIVMTAVLGLCLTGPSLSSNAATSTGDHAYLDWVSVDKVMVNKLGGVNVSGQVSCAGAYAQLVLGNLEYQSGRETNGDPIFSLIPFSEDDDLVNLMANNDNYTVSQPAGRRTMIQVTHGSSRMNPRFVQYTAPSALLHVCGHAGETPCQWETDNFGYDRAHLGPLFDYAPNGKFKAGLLNVNEVSVGLLVEVYHGADTPDETLDVYYVEEGSFAMTSGTIRAVSYR